MEKKNHQMSRGETLSCSNSASFAVEARIEPATFSPVHFAYQVLILPNYGNHYQLQVSFIGQGD
jgi:hypothetical protein